MREGHFFAMTALNFEVGIRLSAPGSMVVSRQWVLTTSTVKSATYLTVSMYVTVRGQYVMEVCCVMLRYAVLCFVMLRYVMLCLVRFGDFYSCYAAQQYRTIRLLCDVTLWQG